MTCLESKSSAKRPRTAGYASANCPSFEVTRGFAFYSDLRDTTLDVLPQALGPSKRSIDDTQNLDCRALMHFQTRHKSHFAKRNEIFTPRPSNLMGCSSTILPLL